MGFPICHSFPRCSVVLWSINSSAAASDIVTVEDIYQQQSETGFPDLDDGDGVQLSKKGQCLSFALFRLLMRRYHGLACAEANLEKTRALVLQGLLPRPRRRDGFRAIEAELGLMHDYFFTGYAFLSRRHRLHYMFIFVSKMVIMYIGGPVLCSSVSSYGSDAQRNIAYLILVLHLGHDLLQLILYCTSDWWTVSDDDSDYVHEPAGFLPIRPRPLLAEQGWAILAATGL